MTHGRRHAIQTFLFIVLGAAALTASVSSASGSGSSDPAATAASGISGPGILGVFQPFTGADAAYGAEGLASCQTAMYTINAAGGVRGNKVQCQSFDSTGDAADAVPVATKMIATTSNLWSIFGPSSVEPAVERIINNASLVHFPDASNPIYDHQTSPWFYQIFPSDSISGVSLAAYARDKGYRKVASAFTTDASAQTSVPSFQKTFVKLGGRIVSKLNLAPDQTSYRTEISQMLATHPQAIVSEMVPQSAATFLSELEQLNGGHLMPIIYTSRAVESDWIKAVKGAIGLPAMERYITPVAFDVKAAGPGYQVYKSGLLHAPGIASRNQYITDFYAYWEYDGYVLTALAVDAANSSQSAKFAPYIARIANGSPGAVVVHSYAAGASALKRGKKIWYIGASGPIYFNASHQNAAAYEGARFTSNGGTSPEPPVLTPKELVRDLSR
jgi:branched-chain amino acid transport system substrate-binding protein